MVFYFRLLHFKENETNSDSSSLKARQKGNKILAIVGMPGSGKSEAADHFRKLGLPVISFSEIVKKTIESKKLPDTLEVHHNARQELRDKYGYEAMALLSHKKITEALKKHKLIVLEGMRSWEEYEYIKKNFSKRA